jgi:hypothetical protein
MRFVPVNFEVELARNHNICQILNWEPLRISKRNWLPATPRAPEPKFWADCEERVFVKVLDDPRQNSKFSDRTLHSWLNMNTTWNSISSDYSSTVRPDSNIERYCDVRQWNYRIGKSSAHGPPMGRHRHTSSFPRSLPNVRTRQMNL